MPPIRTRDRRFPSVHSVLRQADSLSPNATIYYLPVPPPSFVFRYEPYGHAYFNRNHPLMTATHGGDIDWDDCVHFTEALVSDLVLVPTADSHYGHGSSPGRERSLWTRPSRSLSLLAIRLSAYLFLSSSCFHSSSTLHSFGVGRHSDIKNILNPVAVAQLCHKYFHRQAESLLCPILHLGSPIIFKCIVMPSVFIRFVLTVHFSPSIARTFTSAQAPLLRLQTSEC